MDRAGLAVLGIRGLLDAGRCAAATTASLGGAAPSLRLHRAAARWRTVVQRRVLLEGLERATLAPRVDPP
eukprot:11847930-Alexandrium_andersonii.AAC.1